MSDKRERNIRTLGTRSPIEIDAERTLTELLSGKEVSEPIKTGKKIIQTPDSETTIEYELALDPRTGEQQIVEHVSTTKHECGRCDRLSSQLTGCYYCGTKVCGACITSFTDAEGYTWRGVCLSCLAGLTKTRR